MTRTSLKERGISILVSLVFHAVILYLLVKVVPPVRVHFYRQVADVKILSPETMYIPRIEGDAGLEESAGQGEEVLWPVEPAPGTVFLRNLEIDREKDENRSITELYGAIPRFDLVPSSKGEGTFSLGISKESEPEEMVDKEVRKGLDFSTYTAPALSSLRFNRITTRRGERIPSGQLNRNAFRMPEGYDITPWVKEVVDKIRNNWTLPPIDDSIALGEVKIFIVIGKQGNLVAMEVVKSSDFSVFDQTTIAAIRSSAPFLPLPDDFQADRLEAYLVFQFNE